jgi:hypothetical protein
MTQYGALTVNKMTGALATYDSNSEAIDAAVADQNLYAKIAGTSGTLEIAEGETVTIDLNGYAPEIDNKGTLYLINNAATTSVYASGFTFVEGSKEPVKVVAFDGAHYVTFSHQGKTYVYRVDMKISSVSLRPGEAGVYFTAEFTGHTNALKQFDSHGVAVTTTEDELDYTSLGQFLYTEGTGNTVNGVLISNILGEKPAEMANRVTTKIRATAYFTIGDQTCMVTATKGISLQDVVNAVAEMYGAEGKTEDLNEQQKTNMYELYKACKAITVEEGAEPLTWTAIADFDAMIEEENNANNDTEGGDGTGDSTGDGTGENA